MRRLVVACVVVLVAGVVGSVIAPSRDVAGPSVGCAPSWRVVAHSAAVPDLYAVDAVSSRDVWAVGSGKSGAAIVHWNGRRLRTLNLGMKDASLVGVSALSGSDVWAVGWTGQYVSVSQPLVMHFDGRGWRRVPVPSLLAKGVLHLNDVTAVAADDVWAVGEGEHGYAVVHWDGRGWQQTDLGWVPPRKTVLFAIDSLSAVNMWAVGSTGPNVNDYYGFGSIVLRWDGRRWRRVPTGEDPGWHKEDLSGAVDIAPSGEAWALHTEEASEGGSEIVRFSSRGDGSLRKATPFPSHQGAFDYAAAHDLAVVSNADVWAVGSTYIRGRNGWYPLISHWTGTSWRHQNTSLSRLNETSLYGISATSAVDIWAVGSHLVAHYSLLADPHCLRTKTG